MSSPPISSPLASPPAMPAGRGGVLPRTAIAAAYLILCGLILSPLLLTSVPPLVDYPNHLARMWILVDDGKIADLANNYVVHWRLVPNLAMDLLIPVLAHAMPVEAAGRVFIALTMLVLVAGTATLHRSLYGRVGLWPLCSLLFIYNAALFWGFLNCLFGIGIYLLAFSAWIATQRSPLGRRLTMFSVIAVVLLILHLFAFGLYALSIATYELGSRSRARRLTIASLRSFVVTCLHFVPALALWGLSLLGGGSNLTAFGEAGDKFYALLAPATFGSRPMPFDLAVTGFGYLVLAGAIWRRSMSLAPDMRLPLACIGLTAMVMPNWLSGSWLADIRLPVALPFIVIAATRLDIDRKWGAALASVALVLLGMRVGVTSLTWRDYDRRFAEFRAASGVISPGSRLLVVEGAIPDTDRAVPGVPLALAARSEVGYWHMPALTVIDRSAFEPYLFTGLTPIQPTARNAGMYNSVGIPLTQGDLATGEVPGKAATISQTVDFAGQIPYWTNWPNKFDFVLLIDFGRQSAAEFGHIEPVSVGSFFRIYRVVRP